MNSINVDVSPHMMGTLRPLLDPGLLRLPTDERMTQLLRRLCDLLNLTYAAVVEDVDGELVTVGSLGADGPLAATAIDAVGKATSSGEPHVQQSDDTTWWAAAPIPGTRIPGALVIALARAVSSDDLFFLEIAAARAALGVEHDHITAEERAARDDARAQARRNALLLAATRALGDALTREDATSVLLEQATTLLDAVAGSVTVLTDDEAALRVVRATGYPPELLDEWVTFPLDSPAPMAACVVKKQPLFLQTRAEIEAQIPGVSQRSLNQAAVAVPLIARGRAFGAIGLSFAEPREFDEHDRDVIVALARMGAQALDRAALYDAERAERRQVEASRARAAFLSRVSDLLSSGLDDPDVLDRLVRMIVPDLGDWCAIDVAEDGGSARRVSAAHIDPEAADLLRDGSCDLLLTRSVVEALDRLQLQHIQDVDLAEILESEGTDPELAAMLTRIGVRSVVVAPMVARGRALGTLFVGTGSSGRGLGPDEAALVGGVAQRTSVALDNARLLAQTREVAHVLQASLLPASLPRVPGFEIAARYRPSTIGTDVGGDFYDVFLDYEGRWCVVVGDVCGKGPEAAAVTGLARHTVRAIAHHRSSPRDALSDLNDALLDQMPANRFCTAVYARVQDTGTAAHIVLASGGHPLPLVRRTSGLVEAAGRPGVLVGTMPSIDCPEADVDLRRGDAIVFYTDGLVERADARGAVEDAEPVLRAVLARCDDLDAQGIADAVMRVATEAPGAQRDDVAVVVVRYVGEQAPAG